MWFQGHLIDGVGMPVYSLVVRDCENLVLSKRESVNGPLVLRTCASRVAVVKARLCAKVDYQNSILVPRWACSRLNATEARGGE